MPSKSQASTLRRIERQAERDPVLAAWLCAIRETHPTWDPDTLLARRVRVLRAASWFVRAAGECAWDAIVLGGLFEQAVRPALERVEPRFATLTGARAVELAKPKRGPAGAAGVAAAWTSATNAELGSVSAFREALHAFARGGRTREAERVTVKRSAR